MMCAYIPLGQLSIAMNSVSTGKVYMTKHCWAEVRLAAKVALPVTIWVRICQKSQYRAGGKSELE